MTYIDAPVNILQTVTLYASGSIQPVTSPATLGIAETTTNKVNYIYAEFPESTAILEWIIEMPSGWDGGNVTPTFCWTPVAGEANQTCKWVITAIRFANDGALDAAYATGTDATDTWLAIGDYHEIAGSAFTPSGSGNLLAIKVIRDYANDTLVGIARLLAIRIKYTTSTIT